MLGSSYTGGLMERELLGVNQEKKTMEDIRAIGYIPFRKSMEVARNMQPYEDPSDPDPRFANDLLAMICEKLNLKTVDEFKKLRIYTAVDSYLDKVHGVDAWVELDVEGEDMVVVTLDVTKNESKGEEYKADVVFLMPSEGLDPIDDKKEYLAKLEDVSNRIIEAIENKL